MADKENNKERKEVQRVRTYTDVESTYNQIKHLKLYRDLPKEEIMEIARKKVQADEIGIINAFTDTSERKVARALLDKYLSEYSIETISDKNTLKELIYYEVVQCRLQEIMNDLHRTNKTVPTNYLTTLHSNSDAILKLKESLGLNKKKEQDSYDALQHKIRRHKRWMEENQASRTLVCPHCVKMVLLRIRTDIWEAQKHPFFKDKILGSLPLIKCFLTGKLKKEDAADILQVSPDYIDWLIEKWKMHPDYRKMEEEIKIDKHKNLDNIYPDENDIESGITV
jgi:hypothetical protein